MTESGWQSTCPVCSRNCFAPVGKVKCDRCSGSGRITEGWFARKRVRCPKCQGSGYIICRQCRGTGKAK